MIKRIKKYTFIRTDATIALPKGATILHVAKQGANGCIWAEINPKAPLIAYTLHIYPTGQSIDTKRKLKYLGTIFHSNMTFVWHIYIGEQKDG